MLHLAALVLLQHSSETEVGVSGNIVFSMDSVESVAALLWQLMRLCSVGRGRQTNGIAIGQITWPPSGSAVCILARRTSAQDPILEPASCVTIIAE